MILFAGDPHGYFRPIIRAIDEHRPSGVVLLGDYDLERPLKAELGEAATVCPVAWIHGNHDADHTNWYINLFESALDHCNLNATVRTLGGLRIAGLGGIFRGQVWHPHLNNGRPIYTTRDAMTDYRIYHITAIDVRRNKRWRISLGAGE